MIHSHDFVTADYHFGHTNIIKYSNRPYADVQEMNQLLISNWNAKIKPDAIVYFLGDLAFTDLPRLRNIRNQLNGTIRLIRGNHDKKLIKGEALELFDWVKEYHEDTYEDGTLVVMCHYAFRVWNKSHRGSVNLHGHSHGSLPDLGGRQMDVGLDTNPRYEPYSFKEVMSKMLTRQTIASDHHE